MTSPLSYNISAYSLILSLDYENSISKFELIIDFYCGFVNLFLAWLRTFITAIIIHITRGEVGANDFVFGEAAEIQSASNPLFLIALT